MDGIYVIFILMVHLLSFFLYFYTLVEVYLMLHGILLQIKLKCESVEAARSEVSVAR